jgi:hypothetical protein
VYFISIPKVYKTLGGATVTGVTGQGDFAVKVMLNATEFNQEATALREITPVYFLGTYPSEAETKPRPTKKQRRSTIEVFGIESVILEDNVTLPNEDVWWNDKLAVVPGGAVFMKLGEPATQTISDQDFYNAACRGLAEAHSKGWVHCDIRKPNFVVFDNVLHLIDYGMARRIEHDACAYQGDHCNVGFRLAEAVNPSNGRRRMTTR